MAKRHARTYANKLIGYIRRIFKWAVARQLVLPVMHVGLSAVEGLRRGRSEARETAPVPPVDDEAVNATLPFLPEVVRDMVTLQRLTGCRPGEICGIRPCDLDRSSDVWVYKPQRHKTDYRGRERLIFVGPRARAVLSRYLLRPAEAYCFSPADSVEKWRQDMRARRTTRVQPSQQCRRKRRPLKSPGNCYTRNAYCQAIARAVRNANRQRAKEAAKAGREAIPLLHWHPNQLRHSTATEVRREFGLEAAQVVLGHAKADVTQVYAERDARLAAEVARRIG